MSKPNNEVKKTPYFETDSLKEAKKQTNKFRVWFSIFHKRIQHNRFLIITIVFALLYIVASVIDNVNPGEFKLTYKLFSNLIIAVIPAALSLSSLIIESMRGFQFSIIYTSKDIKEKIYNNIYSNRDYTISGYKWYDYKLSDSIHVEKYEMSEQVNNFLTEANFSKDCPKIVVKLKTNKFVIPKSSVNNINYKVRNKIKKGTYIFNSNLMRLSSDLLVNGKDSIEVTVQKTDYFSNIATNDAIYEVTKNVKKELSLIQGNIYSVENLDDDRITLHNLENSYCANIIGISTLAITKDGKIIVLEQGNCDVNKSRLAPSGSGSANYSKIKTKNFITFLTNEMNRELFEETQICKENYNKLNNKDYIIYKEDVKTYVIGYCRLLDRGGKPDFFGITSLDVDSNVIMAYFGKFIERKLNETCKTNEVNNIRLYNSIDEIEKNNGNVTLQLSLICDFIRKLQKESNITEIKELVNRFCNK